MEINYIICINFIIFVGIRRLIMTQITINIEDKSILPHLKKILNAIEGVSIAKPSKQKKCGIDEALDDIKAGRVTHYDNVEDMFKAFGI